MLVMCKYIVLIFCFQFPYDSIKTVSKMIHQNLIFLLKSSFVKFIYRFWRAKQLSGLGQSACSSSFLRF